MDNVIIVLEVGKCWVCDIETDLMDVDFEAYMCSKECQDLMWIRYEAENRRIEQTDWFFVDFNNELD